MRQGFCEACGAKRLEHHKFCVDCGNGFVSLGQDWDRGIDPSESNETEPRADLEMPKIPSSQDQADVEKSAGTAEDTHHGQEPRKLKSIWLPVALIVVLGVCISIWSIWGHGNQSELIHVVITGPANVRDHPSTTDSKVIAKFDEGKKLIGRWVDGINNSSERWLEFEESSRLLYVWEGNLRIEKSHEISDYHLIDPASIYRGTLKFPDFNGRDKDYAIYKTRITEAIKGGPNFYGKYSVIVIGCGTGCKDVYVADVSTGKVYDFPYGGEEHNMLQLSFNIEGNTIEAKWIENLNKCVVDNLIWDGQTFNSQGIKRNLDAKKCFPEWEASNPESCVGRSCQIMTMKGWAGIEVGMTVAKARSVSGLTIRNDGDYDIVDYDCRRYEVVGGPSEISMLVEDGVVTSVTASGKGFRTDRGVKIGDGESVVRLHYKALEEEPDPYGAKGDKQLIYEEQNGVSGIKFIVNSGSVTSITVGGASLRYIEGCL